jgi:biopolymer transport protein ExbD
MSAAFSGVGTEYLGAAASFAEFVVRVWPEKKKRQARIEIIPMIDVMMFLLVFFVLISINVIPAMGLKIKPPSSARPDQIVERQRVTITLDKDGRTFLDGQPVTLADIPEKLAAAASVDVTKKVAVVIAGDEAAALQGLIGVLDALKLSGVASAQIVTRNK